MIRFANVYMDDKGRRWVGTGSLSYNVSRQNTAVLARDGIKTLYRLRIRMKDTQ